MEVLRLIYSTGPNPGPRLSVAASPPSAAFFAARYSAVLRPVRRSSDLSPALGDGEQVKPVTGRCSVRSSSGVEGVVFHLGNSPGGPTPRRAGVSVDRGPHRQFFLHGAQIAGHAAPKVPHPPGRGTEYPLVAPAARPGQTWPIGVRRVNPRPHHLQPGCLRMMQVAAKSATRTPLWPGIPWGYPPVGGPSYTTDAFAKRTHIAHPQGAKATLCATMRQQGGMVVGGAARSGKRTHLRPHSTPLIAPGNQGGQHHRHPAQPRRSFRGRSRATWPSSQSGQALSLTRRCRPTCSGGLAATAIIPTNL